MQPTERLYFTDSDILEFSATVIDIKNADGGDAVLLDRTAFYPTGGGQPNDTGRINDAEVTDVFENEDGLIFHLIKESGSLKPGLKVHGAIDRLRRLDHLQQHSGQHILSQAFVQACGAETRSFHLGSEASTIDIELQSPTDDHMRAAEEVANQIIFEDRPLKIHLVTEEEAARLPLRKETAVSGLIRVIEVEDFDWSPCGGTHAKRAGQIGIILIKSFERAKRMTRVEFVCGRRALADYRRASATAVGIARMFSAERDSAPELVARMIQENKSLKKRQRDLLELALKAEAADMLAAASQVGQFKLIQAVFEGRDAEEVRVLASKIVSLEPAVALLGSRDRQSARMIFARSSQLDQNMGALLAEACQLLGGRGGGKGEMAQGGGPQIDKLDEAIRLAAQKIVQG
ncbi:MAG: DHHA1 domain-containing protein [Acidobacteriota bacterium]